MKRIFSLFLLIVLLLSLCSCAPAGDRKTKIRLLIVPKFEAGEMSGDDLGEAQLFYEEYCRDAEKFELAGTYPLYVNPKNGVALGLTYQGKTNAAIFMSTVLTDPRFDLSDAYILLVGCSGSSYETATLGDVFVITDTVDFDLGYETTMDGENGAEIQWYDNPDTHEIAHTHMNDALVRKVYDLTKDIPLKTTDIARRTLARNFPENEWMQRDPMVLFGTSVTSDTYWKGNLEHQKAAMLAEHYGCASPYMATEMEDAACAAVAETLGVLDRLIVLRVTVNTDVYMDGATPESAWGTIGKYEENVSKENKETLDIFVPAMENIFAVGKKIADAVLDGSIAKN